MKNYLVAFLLCSFFLSAKGQDSTASKGGFAIGYMYKNGAEKGLFGIQWEQGKDDDLAIYFGMNHPWKEFESTHKAYIIKVLRYMDQRGFTLVSTSTRADSFGVPYAYEWIFKKKEEK